MQDFYLYFQIGGQHIADFEGYDHILFLLALCIRYTWADIKALLILITAFTIGHSITLALSVLEWATIPTDWIEFLIPITILFTAINNLLWLKKPKSDNGQLGFYGLALVFGLIHGWGFSNYLKSLLGQSSQVWKELLAFNIGLEVGQIVIVSFILLITTIATGFFKFSKRDYVLFLSGGVSLTAFIMTLERIPF